MSSSENGEIAGSVSQDGLQSGLTSRLRTARPALVVVAALAILAVTFYDIPIIHVLLAAGVLAAALLYAPEDVQPGQRKVSQLQEKGRVWPSTGMKVTVDALASPCFLADGKGAIRYMNAAAEKAFGHGRVGDPLSFSLRAPSLLEAFDRATSSASFERIVWMEKVPTEAWYEASLAPIYLPGTSRALPRRPRPDFVLVTITDMTEQRRLERMRTDFVANASHELRTPLASLAGFIETLQGPAKNDPEARERFLAIMFEQAGRMRRLIDDILSLSRIELKAHVRPDKDVDLIAIVRHTADALAPLARDLEVDIEIVAPDTPALIKGDRDELIQVAENLVENALKYGSSGKKVELIVEQVPNGDAQGFAMKVRDYGQGIADEHIPRLTERFYRVDVETSRSQKGTGLGLAIVKHILARHRAKLTVESKVGEGSVFSVVF